MCPTCRVVRTDLYTVSFTTNPTNDKWNDANSVQRSFTGMNFTATTAGYTIS